MQKRGAHDLGVLPLQNFDRTLLLMFRRPPDNAPIGPPALQEAVRDITAMGGVVVLGFVTAVTPIWSFRELTGEWSFGPLFASIRFAISPQQPD